MRNGDVIGWAAPAIGIALPASDATISLPSQRIHRYALESRLQGSIRLGHGIVAAGPRSACGARPGIHTDSYNNSEATIGMQRF
jgi:hypothetical protein